MAWGGTEGEREGRRERERERGRERERERGQYKRHVEGREGKIIKRKETSRFRKKEKLKGKCSGVLSDRTGMLKAGQRSKYRSQRLCRDHPIVDEMHEGIPTQCQTIVREKRKEEKKEEGEKKTHFPLHSVPHGNVSAQLLQRNRSDSTAAEYETWSTRYAWKK